MHGIIFSELRKYVDDRLGSEGWDRLLVESEVGRRMYLPIQEYPDGDMVALVGAASRTLGIPAEAILEDFGKFIAPSLVGLYRTLVDPAWKTLDLLENTEHTIHTVVRARNHGARPARLQVVRTAPDAVELTYSSERRLCPVAKGIIKGVAEHYGEVVEITEPVCMHKGGTVCQMEIRVIPATASAKASAKAPAKTSAKAAAKASTKAPAEAPAKAAAKAKKKAATRKKRAVTT